MRNNVGGDLYLGVLQCTNMIIADTHFGDGAFSAREEDICGTSARPAATIMFCDCANKLTIDRDIVVSISAAYLNCLSHVIAFRLSYGAGLRRG